MKLEKAIYLQLISIALSIYSSSPDHAYIDIFSTYIGEIYFCKCMVNATNNR